MVVVVVSDARSVVGAADDDDDGVGHVVGLVVVVAVGTRLLEKGSM